LGDINCCIPLEDAEHVLTAFAEVMAEPPNAPVAADRTSSANQLPPVGGALALQTPPLLQSIAHISVSFSLESVRLALISKPAPLMSQLWTGDSPARSTSSAVSATSTLDTALTEFRWSRLSAQVQVPASRSEGVVACIDKLYRLEDVNFSSAISEFQIVVAGVALDAQRDPWSLANCAPFLGHADAVLAISGNAFKTQRAPIVISEVVPSVLSSEVLLETARISVDVSAQSLALSALTAAQIVQLLNRISPPAPAEQTNVSAALADQTHRQPWLLQAILRERSATAKWICQTIDARLHAPSVLKWQQQVASIGSGAPSVGISHGSVIAQDSLGAAPLWQLTISGLAATAALKSQSSMVSIPEVEVEQKESPSSQHAVLSAQLSFDDIIVDHAGPSTTARPVMPPPIPVAMRAESQLRRRYAGGVVAAPAPAFANGGILGEVDEEPQIERPSPYGAISPLSDYPLLRWLDCKAGAELALRLPQDSELLVTVASTQLSHEVMCVSIASL